ncbi:MAG: molybdopterin synthase sulfur carrier subunit [Thermoproteota archaeon]|jgi:molybdopterin converting factor small subunit|uniref:Molybdopterin synthase sulfur carrier subunit n=1 Tax=Candidatus Methanodesulfokora washburnensis TaxID=2478471 RepID=A0A520KJV8_9CREN|nr:MAG: molybdopterin synthase sulfur carrier subunit [Candidatus Methanodesulfokores washburnensis]TDA41455.1 MAG: molybdopterin synthase sulfur carrier subunit [Candidatus Korarchaeota archaeon]
MKLKFIGPLADLAGGREIEIKGRKELKEVIDSLPDKAKSIIMSGRIIILVNGRSVKLEERVELGEEDLVVFLPEIGGGSSCIAFSLI